MFFILFLLLRHFESEEWAKLQHDFGWIDAPFVWIGWGWDWCWHWIVQWVPLGEPWLSIAQWSVGLFAAFLVFGVLNEFALWLDRWWHVPTKLERQQWEAEKERLRQREAEEQARRAEEQAKRDAEHQRFEEEREQRKRQGRNIYTGGKLLPIDLPIAKGAVERLDYVYPPEYWADRPRYISPYL